MGCNTSKECVPSAGAKEDVKDGDVRKKSKGNSAKVDSKESHQEKTEVTKESESKESKESESKESKETESKESKESTGSEESKEEEKKAEKVTDKEREEAATRIQAAYRGHHARKSMQESESSAKQTETKSSLEPTKEQLQQEFRADDKELCEAASKNQASSHGHMSIKEQVAILAKSADNAAEKVISKAEEQTKETMNELLEGIDLTDPDLHKAATKIQASFRGHKVRQEVLVNPAHNEEPKK